MELRQLVYFIAVIEHKGFSQAANALYVSQPTVTMAVKRLERELEADLLERKNTGVELTPEGEIFYRHAHSILAEVEAAKQQIERQKSVRKSLFIGVPSMACADYYPIIYRFFQERNEDIHIRIQDLRSPEVFLQVCTEDIELGLAMVIEDVPAAVEVVRLRQDRIRLMLPVNHPLSQYEKISLAQLSDEVVFMSWGKTYIYERIQKTFAKAGLPLNINESFRDNQTIINMVTQGFGVYFFPNTASTTVADNPRIAIRDLDVDLIYDIGLIYKKNRHLSEPARRLITFLEKLRT